MLFKTKQKNSKQRRFRKTEIAVPLSINECIHRLQNKVNATRKAVPHTEQKWFEDLTFKATSVNQNSYRFTITNAPDQKNALFMVSGTIDAIDEHHAQVNYRGIVNGCIMLIGIPAGLLMLYLMAEATPPKDAPYLLCGVPLAVLFILMGGHTGLTLYWEIPQIKALIHEALDTPYGGPEPTPNIIMLEGLLGYGLILTPFLIIVMLPLLILEASPRLMVGLPLLLVGGFLIYSRLLPNIFDENIERALARCDYDQALFWNNTAKWLLPLYSLTSHAISTSHTSLLVQAARYDEAETILTRQLSTKRLLSRGDNNKVEMLCNLGTIALVKEDRPCARQYYERALAQTQNKIVEVMFSSVYSALAGWYLTIGEPEHALAMLDQAYPRTGFTTHQFRFRYEIIQAGQAWAYAQQGHTNLAREMLAEALEPRAETYLPGEAALHHIAGRVMHLIGEPDAARGHFKTAIKLDPNGHRGHVSRQALFAMEA